MELEEQSLIVDSMLKRSEGMLTQENFSVCMTLHLVVSGGYNTLQITFFFFAAQDQVILVV